MASDWSSVAELRQGLYRFFAGALLLPDAERLSTLDAAAEVLAGMGIDDFAFADQWHAMEDALAAVEAVEELEGQYVRLFVSDGEGAATPPLESQHLASASDLGRVTAEVQRAYVELGLEVAPGLPYPTDHVATQMEVMSSLCHREAHAWDEQDVAAAVATLRQEWKFLDRHLARWLPNLARRLREEAGGFYVALVDAAEAFVVHDQELVTMLAKTPVAGVGR